MLVYALVSLETEKAVDLFPTQQAAERSLEEVRQDEPELAERLRMEAIRLGEVSPN